MRSILTLLFLPVVLIPATDLFGQQDQAAVAIIDKAIKATGGADALSKLRIQTWEESGTYHGAGDPIQYTGKYAVKYPDKYRMEIEGFMTIVLNGDKAWMNSMGSTNEVTGDPLQEQMHTHYAGWIATLLPLKEKSFKLSILDEVKVEDKPAVGVKVAKEGSRDVNLFFDKESGLLVKVETKVKPQELGGKEVSQETIVKQHKEIDGLQQPVKIEIKHDGKRFVEAELSRIESKKDLEDSVFAKP